MIGFDISTCHSEFICKTVLGLWFNMLATLTTLNTNKTPTNEGIHEDAVAQIGSVLLDFMVPTRLI